MYLASQLVRSPAHGRSGINVAIYRHAREVPGIDWHFPDVALIAERYPGDLVAHVREVETGGNLVLAYVDVAFDDAMPIDVLLRRLEGVGLSRPTTSPPMMWTHDEIGVRFWLQPQLGLKEIAIYAAAQKEIAIYAAAHDSTRHVSAAV